MLIGALVSFPGDKTVEIRYCHLLNKVLPPEIRVLAWCPVPRDFSARSVSAWCPVPRDFSTRSVSAWCPVPRDFSARSVSTWCPVPPDFSTRFVPGALFLLTSVPGQSVSGFHLVPCQMASLMKSHPEVIEMAYQVGWGKGVS